MRFGRSRGLLLLGPMLISACGRDTSPPRGALAREPVRDVVLITIDTLRADAVGFEGNSRGTTPNLDRFAREGRTFPAHAHTVITLPSHTNILTGLYPYQHGVRDNTGFRLDVRFATAATILKEKGFATGAFVAAFPLDSRYGLSRGFDTYEELYRHVDDPVDFEIQQSRADAVVPAALAWWRERAGAARFLWVHVYDPHAAYNPPEDYKTRFPDDFYLGEVAFTDAALAPLLEAVRATTPTPLLVVTGDHGEARGDHGEATHGLFAYEPTLRIPLFVWSPGRVQPGRDPDPARHVDILPTILEAVGDGAKRDLPGASLVSGNRSRDGSSYFESLSTSLNRGWAPLRGLIGEGHKYIDLPIPELYDLSADPGETRNLVSVGPDVLRRLRKRFLEIPTGPAEPGPVGSDEAKALRSLGYLSGSGEKKASYGPEDDPKSLIGVDRQLHDVIDKFERGNLDLAIALARRIVVENPAMPMGYQQLAYLLQEKGDVEGAIRVYQQARSSGVGGESMDRRLALIFSEYGRPKEAVALLVPHRESQSPETLNALGMALADAGRPGDALPVFARAFQFDPESGLTHQNVGITLLRLNRAQEARQNLEKALAINARNPRAWNALGVAWMRLEAPVKALDAWTRAVEYNPEQYDALYNIGLVASRMGDRGRAREALERFVATAPRPRYARDIAEVRAVLAVLRKGTSR